MTHPDSNAVDLAIVNALQADAALRALMPDGVYFNMAPPGAKRFVLVGIFDSNDEGVFGGRAIESVLYFVKAVAFSGVARIAEARDAAQRIDEVLEGATLAPADFSWMDCAREERLADTVPDPIDPSKFWFHFGGHYRVNVAWIDPSEVTR